MVRKIVLSVASVLMLCAVALAQNKQVSGTVTGSDGAPIIGATVVVDGTTIGTSTDLQGQYVLDVPADGVLLVSFIGYEDAKVPVNGKTSIDVVLQESTQGIEDIIVTAYGQAKREAFTGSAAMVKSEDLVKSQTSNAVDALNGKVPGLQILNASGQPGASSPTVVIRGFSSINAGTSPLIILDGMSFAGGLNDINPSDIESMSVLKDAAAAALYGSRGANGVILITTKRAKSQEAIVNVDIKVGVNQRAKQDYDIIKNPGEHYEAHYSLLKNYYEWEQGQSSYNAHISANGVLTTATNGGLGYNVYELPAGQNLIGLNGKLNPNAALGRKVTYNGQSYLLTPDNWTDEIYMDGIRQEYNVNVAASTGKSNFYGSFGYLNNEGIVKATGYERYTARLRADYQAKKWLKVGGNASYSHAYSNVATAEGDSSSSGNIFNFTTQIAPIYPLYVRDGEGNIMYDERGHVIYDYGTATNAGSNAGLVRPFMPNTNAYGDHLLDKHNSTTNMASFNGFADIILPEGFKFSFNGGVSMSQGESLSTGNILYGQSAMTGGYIDRVSGIAWSYTLQQILSWNRQFGQHTVDAMIGHENNYDMSRSMSTSKSGLFTTDATELSQALKMSSMSSSISRYSNEGYFLRAQYDYAGRIFAAASFRRDASSRFHPKHRWGNFWSVSAGWLINRESWFNARWVDELKVKASYGSQGNDQIGNYLYMDLYSIANDGTDNWSVSFAQKGNEYITWETNSNFNAGVDFGLFGYRLSGTLEYFYRKTSDMLSWFTVPASMGYSGYYKNVGDMANQGVELSLNAGLIRTKNFQWDFNLNATYVNNKVLKLADSAVTESYYDLEGNKYYGYRDGSNFYGLGKALYTKVYKAYAGVEEETGKPLFWARREFVNRVTGKTDVEMYKTTDYASDADYFVFDTSLPDLYGGFGTTFSAYGFDLSLNFVYQIGGTVYDSDYAFYMSSPSTSTVGNAYHKDIYKAWTPQNKVTDVPRFVMGDMYTAASSDRFVTDASYLSLQNINFGYTFPSKWMSKAHISKLRIYLACENVWLWSQRKGLDPRQSITGGASAAYYSPMRTISGGVNVTF
ncbi:MAG: TonB-dependent receptor [Alistipes sp.]|nr:TonB-dependent receptor [Alistipes sp.]